MMGEGKIALFGGSFNPIHHGHLIVARAAAERLGAARVVFIPSPNPPHKSGLVLADAADRLEMVRLAIAGEPMFESSDVEIRRAGPSYTILTIEDFRRELPGRDLVWLIGADSLAFISIDGLYRALGREGRDPNAPAYCDACFTGDYAIPLTDRTDNAEQRGSLLKASA